MGLVHNPPPVNLVFPVAVVNKDDQGNHVCINPANARTTSYYCLTFDNSQLTHLHHYHILKKSSSSSSRPYSLVTPSRVPNQRAPSRLTFDKPVNSGIVDVGKVGAVAGADVDEVCGVHRSMFRVR